MVSRGVRVSHGERAGQPEGPGAAPIQGVECLDGRPDGRRAAPGCSQPDEAAREDEEPHGGRRPVKSPTSHPLGSLRGEGKELRGWVPRCRWGEGGERICWLWPYLTGEGLEAPEAQQHHHQTGGLYHISDAHQLREHTQNQRGVTSGAQAVDPAAASRGPPSCPRSPPRAPIHRQQPQACQSPEYRQQPGGGAPNPGPPATRRGAGAPISPTAAAATTSAAPYPPRSDLKREEPSAS